MRLTSLADDLKGDAVSHALEQTIRASLISLSKCDRQPLNCDMEKAYFSFRGDDSRLTRPINDSLFDERLTTSFVAKVLNCEVEEMPFDVLERVLYTLAISYCAAADLVKTGDKKTPATFFEKLTGHLVGRSLGVNPKNFIEIQSLEIRNSLPTDFIFDLGHGNSKIHMPVKTSTRERVIQVWAHQRVIDGVFGLGRFKGVLVSIAETNAKPNFGVTEVCLPDQWVIYQMFIAQMHRIYYFDLPRKYAELGLKYPFIQVKKFASFFSEASQLAVGSPIA